MNLEAVFIKRLMGLAKLLRHNIDEEVLGFYDRALSPLGYQALCDALDRIAMEAEDGAKFPSIAAIRRAATGERLPSEAKYSDDGEAREAASRIIGAVSKYGAVIGIDEGAYEKIQTVRTFIGELGWTVVEERGGWNCICGMLTNQNMATVEAQFRELAKSKLERARRGLELTPPALPSRTPVSDGLKPISQIGSASLFSPEINAMLESRKGRR